MRNQLRPALCRLSSRRDEWNSKAGEQASRRAQICSPKTQPGRMACGLAASRHLRMAVSTKFHWLCAVTINRTYRPACRRLPDETGTLSQRGYVAPVDYTSSWGLGGHSSSSDDERHENPST